MGERCGRCGFAYDESGHPAAAGACRRVARDIADLLVDGRDAGRRAPGDRSPLEVAGAAAEELLARYRLILDALGSRPTPDRDGPAADGGDGATDPRPDAVGRRLVDAADRFAAALRSLPPEAWNLTVVDGDPPAPRSLRRVAVGTLHQLIHDRHDIESQPSAT